MNKARITFLTVAATIATVTMIGLACATTQSPTIITYQVEEANTVHADKTPELSVPTPMTVSVATGRGVTVFWCDDEYCYRTENWPDEKCLRIERDPLFDIAHHSALMTELMTDGNSTPCIRAGPFGLLPRPPIPENDDPNLPQLDP